LPANKLRYFDTKHFDFFYGNWRVLDNVVQQSSGEVDPKPMSFARDGPQK
jgi:hypothetical protein